MARENGMKEAAKACKLAERAYGKAKFPPAWAVRLHDYCFERQERLVAEFTRLDPDNIGAIRETEFLAVLEDLGATLPTNVKMLEKKLLKPHRVENSKPKATYYRLFLGGHKLLPKKFLMSAYVPKVKRTKPRRLRKTKDKPFAICRQPASAAEEGLVHRHLLVTDWSLYDRDHPPDHPIQDDSVWYVAPAEQQMIQLTASLRQRDEHTIDDAFYDNPLTQVNTPDLYWRTPLMIAARMGDLEMVKWLVDAGLVLMCAHDYPGGVPDVRRLLRIAR